MKNQRSRYFATMIVAAALLLGCQTAFAQMRIVGVISGVVTDPAGALVPNAKVVLKDEVNGTRKEASTNGSGQFQFPDLPFGSFEVTVTAAGFETAIVSHISVVASQTTDVPIKLKVGTASESVTVEGTSPVLETTSPLVNTTTESKEINELPSTSRSMLSFAALVPGKTVSGSGDTRFNNIPGGAVEVTVDGINDASNGYKSGGTVFYMTVPVRLGALEEISVETSGLAADAGAESGANLKFITKRGGNQYHGSLFYQPTSEQFNANSWNNNATRTPRAYNRVHNFGGNFGGPLVPFGSMRNKLFFFFNYEYVYNPQAVTNSFTVANPATLQGNYTYLLNGSLTQTNTVNVLTIAQQMGAPYGIDPVAQSILTANAKVPSYATPQPTTSFNTTNWIWRTDNNLYQYYPTTRFDYYITPREQVTFAWNLEHSWQPGAERLQGGDRANPFRIGGYFTWNVALQSAITPTMFNEARYGVQHSGDSNASATAGYGSYFTYNGTPMRIGSTLPFGATVPYIDQQNVTGRHYITTIYDTVTKIHGNHTITGGVSFRRTDWHDTGEIFPVPTYATGTPSGDTLPATLFTSSTLPGDAPGDLTGNPVNLYNELVGRISRSSLSVIVDPATKQYGGFINHTWTRSYMGGAWAQDRWRLSPDLTITAGLRWEAQGPMYDVEGITAVPTNADIYGPSVSLFTPGALSSNPTPTASIGRMPYNTDWKKVAPNVGLAWNPDVSQGWLGKIVGGKKTVFRASFGMIVYDEGTQMFAQNLGTNPGKSASQTIIAGQTGLAQFTTLAQIAANPLTPAAFTGIAPYSPTVYQANQTFSTTLNGMNQRLVAPYTNNWSIGVQREVAKGTVVEVRYVGNQSHHGWVTSNLNEINIFESGFLKDFQAAQNNLAIANGMTIAQMTAQPTVPILKTNNFQDVGLAGQQPTPILDAAFGARGTVPAIAATSGYSNPTFVGYLQSGAAGSFAGSIATNQIYVCRMFGSNFAPCTQARVQPSSTQSYAAPGSSYPINLFQLNPYSPGTLEYVDDTGWTSYNAAQIQVRRQYYKGLVWTSNFTFSKGLANNGADSANQGFDYITWRNLNLSRRPSLFDQRVDWQNFGSYELPFGKGRLVSINNRILDAVVGGWTAGAVVEFGTGTPVQLTGGTNTFNNQSSGVILGSGVTLNEISSLFHTNANYQKVNQVGNPNPLLARANATDTTRLALPLNWLDSSGKANPQLITYNNVPGSLGQILYIYGMNTITFNASMTKTFRITERWKFQIFASANNVMNHPAWGLPSANVASTSFGTVGSPSGNRSMAFRANVLF
ncbi:MAG TPA: carboxypeptidase-like regulatory domain-containing protein [Verrucomicrobiae bacterium]|nr:carboxypeptidase-like regulatory domain-containing protein [Verrucomicrobiae bacterium]